MKFIVFGGYGIIGKAVVADLAKFTSNKDQIIIAGRDIKKASRYSKSFKSSRAQAKQINIQNQTQLINILKESNVCINCLQYYFNLDIMKACIKAKTHYLDLGGLFHMTKKQIKLHNQFKKIGKTAILGIGGAPGISNILAAYGSQFLNKVNTIEIVFADKDYTKYNQSFVLPYSFKTLVEEFTLPPAIFKNGRIIFTKPHSGINAYKFPDDFGNLQSFLTLHSEIATLPQFLKNKGLKNLSFRVTFPKDFTKKILDLVELGFTSKENIDITTAIIDKLIPANNIKINDKEIIRVIIDNKVTLDAITHSSSNIPAGVLDTAVPCSIAAIMLAHNKITKRGVYAPESIINPLLFFKELRKRGVEIRKNNEVVN